MIKDFDLLQRANNDYTTIDLEHAEELAYRELIDSIRYISLGDECGVMGNIANIITYKGRGPVPSASVTLFRVWVKVV